VKKKRKKKANLVELGESGRFWKPHFVV